MISEDTQKRKPIKGLLLKYYRMLYSVSTLPKDTPGFSLYNPGPLKIARNHISLGTALMALILIIHVLFPVIGFYPDVRSKIYIILVIGLLLYLLADVLTKRVLASDALIEKISQYEEVRVEDKKEQQRIYSKFNGICTFIFILVIIGLRSIFGVN